MHLLSKLKLVAVTRRNCYNVLIYFYFYQDNDWYIFDCMLLIIMVKTMFCFVFIISRWCEYWTKRHIICLIASPWKITPKVMTAVRINYDDVCGKIMSSSCSYHVTE